MVKLETQIFVSKCTAWSGILGEVHMIATAYLGMPKTCRDNCVLATTSCIKVCVLCPAHIYVVPNGEE